MERLSEEIHRAHEAPLLVESEEQRIQLLLDFAACYEKRGEPATWGATPSSIFESLADQTGLIHQFARRHVVPNHLTHIHESVQGYIEEKSISRFVNRCMANDENYIRALSPNPFDESDDTRTDRLKRVEDKSKKGHASPAEIIAIQAIEYIGAVELASLTCPYGANIEYLEDMRATVESAVRLFGGEIYDEPEVHFSISDVINGDVPETIDPEAYEYFTPSEKIQQRELLGGVVGLLMTRKRTIGVLPDGTVIRERTSFVLTEESGVLTEGNLSAFAATDECEHWGREAVGQIGGLDFYLGGMLEKNETSKAVPVASTIYAFNKERLEIIDQAIKAHNDGLSAQLPGHAMHNQLRQLAAEQLYAAGKNGMVRDTRAYEDRNGLAFFDKANDATTSSNH